MATVPSPRRVTRPVEYPTTDGKPMAETEPHRKLMTALIESLEYHFRAAPDVCATGNLLVFYERGDRRKHVSPDVFVARGVPKRVRLNYLIWEEGVAPEVVFELTSRTTRREDIGQKTALYRDVLKVKEYFLFDLFGEYLSPQLQGYRLRAGRYTRIRPVSGRLPSQILGLHLEPVGDQLRLYDPVTDRWVTTTAEREQQEAQRAAQAEAEVERLRRELEELRRGR